MASSTGPINLSGVIFRAQQDTDNEDPITFGRDDYTAVPGRVPLSRMRFRAWENNGLASIGGVPDEGGGGGDGGGGGPGGGPETGTNYLSLSVTSGGYAMVSFSPVTDVYIGMDIRFAAGAIEAWDHGQFSFGPVPMEIYDHNNVFVDGPFFGRFTGVNWQWGSSWIDGLFGDPVVDETTYYLEMRVRRNATPTNGTSFPYTFDTQLKIDGEEIMPLTEHQFEHGTTAGDIGKIIIGSAFNSYADFPLIVDNVEFATGDFPNSGGSVFFSADFEDGNITPPFISSANASVQPW